ncbi:hypothetical protein FRC01_010051, partial [Tulasnella sp. 417]
MQAWAEQAALKCSAHQRSTPTFSLVLRAAPLGEWIVSAKAGRMDDGRLFLEHLRQQDLTSVNETNPRMIEARLRE